MERAIRVMVVSPWPAVRAGLSAQVSSDPPLVLAGQSSGGPELAGSLAAARPDIVLADLAPSTLAPVISALGPLILGLVLLSEDRGPVELLEGSGISGWAILPRDSEAAEVVAACRSAAEGMIVFGRGMYTARESSPTSRLGPDESGLTVREREVLQLLADGLPNKVIAVRLSVSLHTVKFHVASILTKLGASSRTEAVTIGARGGLVTL